MSNSASPFLSAAVITLLIAPEAAAYIDPGVGDLLFQVVIAGVLVLLITGKRWIPRVVKWVKNKFC